MQKKADTSELRREPRHLALASDIRQQISCGQLAPGDQLPSFNDLRERWGVGRDTLERMYAALEKDGLIAREARRGIFVTEPRKAKTIGTIGTIGFVTGSPAHGAHPYYTHLLEGVRRNAEFANVELLLLGETATIHWEKVDGVLYQASIEDRIETMGAPPGLARVSLIYGRPSLDSALADDYPGMYEATEHLLQLGHRRIAFLTLEMQPHSLSRLRTAAYHDALRAAGIEPQPAWMRCLHEPDKTGRTWETTGFDEIRDWLNEDWNSLGCTAIFAHNDETAIGVIAALQEAGLRVPQDVSVVGFDGTEIANFHRPRLTTVKVPLEEIGARGFDLLMQQLNQSLLDINQKRLPLRLTLPTQLQIGQTTAGV